MVQTGVKLETVAVEERQSVKDALSSLDGGDVFNEAVAACYCCNKVGHIATKCRTRDVYCAICKNSRHMTEACSTKRVP